MTINYRKIISTLLVLVIAVVTGLSVGKIYIDNLEVPTVVGASEEELREDKSTVEAWVREAASKNPAAFNALQAYLIAEYKLFNSEVFYKIMTGTVFAAAGVKQQMQGERLKNGKMYYYNKLSPSTSSLAPAICSRIIANADDLNNIKVYPTGSFVSTSPKIVGKFDESVAQTYSLEKYKQTFNTLPTSVMPYIISSTTCASAKNSTPKKNTDGTFSFALSIDGASLSMAGLYYAYEIKFSSGMGSLPKWVSLQMNVTMDKDFNFVQIEYDEVYKMNAPVIGWTSVNDKFVDEFYFPETAPDKIPTVEEFLGEVA